MGSSMVPLPLGWLHGYTHELEKREQHVRDFADQAALPTSTRAARSEQQIESLSRRQFAGEALVHTWIGSGISASVVPGNVERHVYVHRSRAAVAQKADALLDGERQHFTRRRLKALFTSGRMTEGKSPWKYGRFLERDRLNWVVGTCRLIARNADESIMPRRADRKMHDPGPHEVKSPPAHGGTCSYASAM